MQIFSQSDSFKYFNKNVTCFPVIPEAPWNVNNIKDVTDLQKSQVGFSIQNILSGDVLNMNKPMMCDIAYLSVGLYIHFQEENLWKLIGLSDSIKEKWQYESLIFSQDGLQMFRWKEIKTWKVDDLWKHLLERLDNLEFAFKHIKVHVHVVNQFSIKRII